ncbi:hypothetical protein RIR_e6683_jg21075.t1 [Rhizophagus irregularis DAOM 181602=DAOM 197198]|nr:hypothetical protein RIR_e6683_jg21075.t1 [Rhizophagus irregularis DAOM 181602=DAOM 197198]
MIFRYFLQNTISFLV